MIILKSCQRRKKRKVVPNLILQFYLFDFNLFHFGIETAVHIYKVIRLIKAKKQGQYCIKTCKNHEIVQI